MTRDRLARAEYGLRLATPGFVGGAQQQGEWRVPPLKALLRQWWRIAVAKELGYDWRKVREREGPLFGHAWLDEGHGGARARRSAVELALHEWREGDMRDWPKDPFVAHPEVGNGGRKVGSHLYLGYGALDHRKGSGTILRRSSALSPGSAATVRLRFPETEGPAIERALHLANLFGTIGGRSRNGWGSVELLRNGQPLPGLEDPGTRDLVARVSRHWEQCLKEEWAHAIGTDGQGPLLWRTEPLPSWSKAMERLAQIKIEFRTKLDAGRKGGPPVERHLLAYPVTHHEVNGWRKARLGNQIRFKVARDGDRWRGIVLHLPCRLPHSLRSKGGEGIAERAPEVFAKVHEALHRQGLERWPWR